MNTTAKILASITAAAALAVTGCGSDEPRQTSDGDDIFSLIGDMARDIAEAAKAQKRSKRCERILSPLITELEDLEARISVGLNLLEYEDALHDVSTAYHSIDYKAAGVGCLAAAGLPLEKAFTLYADAKDEWSDCIWVEYDCDVDVIEPELQIKWEKASSKIDAAHDGLERMADPEWTKWNESQNA